MEARWKRYKELEAEVAALKMALAVLRALVGEKDEGLLALLEFYSDLGVQGRAIARHTAATTLASPKTPCGSVWRRRSERRV